MRARALFELRALLAAVQFLTRVPVPAAIGHAAGLLDAAARYFPLVGALVGAAGAAVFALCDVVFPQPLAVLLSTAATLLLTGAFHEDGFADACDGLGGGATREAALAIMRDSRLGTYGAAGLGLMLGAKILTLGALAPALVPFALVAGHAASRASAVVVIATAHYAREDGTAKPLATAVGPSAVLFAAACGIAPVAALGLPGFMALGGLALGHLAMRRAFMAKLGGYTGDCLGAVQQTSEIGFLLALLAATAG